MRHRKTFGFNQLPDAVHLFHRCQAAVGDLVDDLAQFVRAAWNSTGQLTGNKCPVWWHGQQPKYFQLELKKIGIRVFFKTTFV
ncbi:hypothetical protein A7M48_22820 [Acinetobacter baumannii]|nr:hypothetical protein A7M48_22820 [Acinetobacter baumannii]